MGWQRAASVHDLKTEDGFQVQIGDKTIALFRLVEKVYALEGLCPHAEAFLAEGIVDGRMVECPLHQARFDIPTGKCISPPADRDLTTYPVKIEGDDVLVDLGSTCEAT
jgi:3-phenylpropionate/trans-cinnamate dioxygenase ferredoxin subunit